ncbi:MAG: hypothetical protein LBD44_04250, partial [Spirochaetaceae bacterium]|nr:hypothetical protein [Spirochaetaceae bacterium]
AVESDERLAAWFKTFHENAVKAVNAAVDGQTEAAPRTPAELDREFLEIIRDGAEFDDFLGRAAQIYNNEFREGAIDEEEGAAMAAELELRDDMRRALTHGNWTSLFKNEGRISEEGHRKRLLGLIRKNPRDYRGLYARVMDVPELAVRPEDSQSAALMYELADSKREDIQGLSPEKLRELADQNEVDEFAEQLRTGKAKFVSEVEKRYIKQQDRQIKDLRETIDELTAANKEDMTYLNRIAGKEFMTAFDRAVKLKENVRRQSDKLERAVRRNSVDAGKAARFNCGPQCSRPFIVNR